VAPVIVSPRLNSPETDPTSRVFVSELNTLTLAVVPLEDPVTISLNWNVPDPDPSASPIVTVGGITYPKPPSVILIEVIVPAELTTGTPVALEIPGTVAKSM
jgi:hypothetical protein